MSDWLHSRWPIHPFADSTLETASVVHVDGCRAAANESGIAPMVHCSSRFCTSQHLPARTPVQQLARTENSLLVATNGSGPFWIEAGLLEPCSAPVEPPKKQTARSHTVLLPPPDFLMVDALLGQGLIKLPRRQRPLKGGEVVFIRSERADKSKELQIWRFLALSFNNHDEPIALVIDASIPFDSALNPGWAQCKPLTLMRNGQTIGPHQLLIPIFPLPDGREDPGWRSESRT